MCRPCGSNYRSTPITLASLPLEFGSKGADVADLQRRLHAAGFVVDDPRGDFSQSTTTALSDFQRDHGLNVNGSCDSLTWSALIESQFSLGDRLLCLRSPMMRGDDVSELQLRLGALGFDAGRVDGILGPMTQSAVGEFQRNAGLISDTVCSPETVSCLLRLEGRGGNSPVTGVRERVHLRRRKSSDNQLRVALGMTSQLSGVLSRFASELQQSGTSVLLLEELEWTEQASRTNEFGADIFVGLTIMSTPTVEACYFSVPGYESDGGRRLAELIVSELPASPGWGIGSVHGMRLQILRETRPPAVLVKLGDEELLATSGDLVIASLHRAISAWELNPC